MTAPGRGKDGGDVTDLGGGLVLRGATVDDTEPIAALIADRGGDMAEPRGPIPTWTRDLMAGNLPGFSPGDFTVVEDMGTGQIVSTLNLISQTWSYEGIAFPVGRVDAVVTDRAYRRRGLSRAQMDLLHRWSAERGEMVLGITGIPWYYRQFGYELALAWQGGRRGYAGSELGLQAGETACYRFRPATEADVPLLAELYAEGMKRYTVSCVRDEEMFRYDLDAPVDKATHWNVSLVIETADGDPVGMLRHGHRLRDGVMAAGVYELRPGTPWLEVTPSVVRRLRATGERYARRDGVGYSGGFALSLGVEHPAYAAMKEWLPVVEPSRAWYLRVPDLPGFVRHVAPALERRLSDAFGAAYTGRLVLGFVHGGLVMDIEDGHITSVEPRTPTQDDLSATESAVDALFPGLVFLQLLFGFRSVREIEYAYPDCIVTSNESRSLLGALFPKRPSMVYGIQ